MGRLCLVTATDSRFLPGAFTTVGSFLRHHPRFDGDVVVHDGGLSRESRGYLEALSGRVRLEPLARALGDRLAALAVDPRFPPARLMQLCSLEAFRQTGHRKVLFCDADLLFRAPVDELFDDDADLLCCGDGAHVRGLRRAPATFQPTCAQEGLDGLDGTPGVSLVHDAGQGGLDGRGSGDPGLRNPARTVREEDAS